MKVRAETDHIGDPTHVLMLHLVPTAAPTSVFAPTFYYPDYNPMTPTSEA